MLCMRTRPFQLMNKFNDFHKTWYKHYTTGGQKITVLLYPTLINNNIPKTYNSAARVTVAPLIMGVK